MRSENSHQNLNQLKVDESAIELAVKREFTVPWLPEILVSFALFPIREPLATRVEFTEA
jgi:hypothetical protein